MRSERLATSIGGHLGVFGILTSGIVMVTWPKWGWFNLLLNPWLAIKQILFLVILVLVGIAMKRSIAFKKRLKQEDDVPSTDASDKWRSAYRMSMAVYILVVINTILGLTKPLLG